MASKKPSKSSKSTTKNAKDAIKADTPPSQLRSPPNNIGNKTSIEFIEAAIKNIEDAIAVEGKKSPRNEQVINRLNYQLKRHKDNLAIITKN